MEKLAITAPPGVDLLVEKILSEVAPGVPVFYPREALAAAALSGEPLSDKLADFVDDGVMLGIVSDGATESDADIVVVWTRDQAVELAGAVRMAYYGGDVAALFASPEWRELFGMSNVFFSFAAGLDYDHPAPTVESLTELLAQGAEDPFEAADEVADDVIDGPAAEPGDPDDGEM